MGRAKENTNELNTYPCFKKQKRIGGRKMYTSDQNTQQDVMCFGSSNEGEFTFA